MARYRRGRAGRRSRVRRFVEVIAVVALFAVVAVAAAVLDKASMRDVSGVADVVDGDTLVLRGERIRLMGMDAPELDQVCRRGGGDYPCGRQAHAFLKAMIDGRDVVCRGNEPDRYGRLLARCFTGQGDINAAMVLAGWAVSFHDYPAQEREAKARSAGLWAGSFQRPADWRAARGGIVDIGPAGMANRISRALRAIFAGRQQGEGA